MVHALVVEDDPASLTALDQLVQKHGYSTTCASSLEEARKQLKAKVPEVVLVDLDLPDGNGIELVREIHDDPHDGFETEIIVVTGHGSVDTAVDALQLGAMDYLQKPIDPKRLKGVLQNLRRTLELRRQVTELREELRQFGRFEAFVGSSTAAQRMYDLISKVARTSCTVLITGETGTGKDLVAQTVHRLSRRADKPFVAVNCGAIQESLIESELFGHEPGSFTGANRTRRGLFEQANGGTIFLDEITEMPLDLQVKLLRVLENKQITRVGGERTIEVDVRVIAATNRRPEEAVEAKKLREDLFYRLKVFPIEVPALRERVDDIELIASHFLERLNEEGEHRKRFTSDALDRLRGHAWPGNVRELRNVVERAYILASEEEIDEDSIMLDEEDPFDRNGTAAGSLRIDVGATSIAQAEKQLILATLDELEGNKREAARVLGISLKTLYNRLNSYGMGRARSA